MSRVTSLKKSLPALEKSIQQFVSSSSNFRVLQTIGFDHTEPKTLFILDSSFNPPSKAHFHLARNAVAQKDLPFREPFRLLLLFSTHNADKASSDQSVFAQRLAYMTLLAQDLSDQFAKDASSKSDGIRSPPSSIPIDIGLTKKPYYHDKSEAIEDTEPAPYPSGTSHVHLVGYDNIIRICAPRYYKDHNPPLSALSGFFEAGHRFLVTTRPHVPSDKSSEKFGTIEEQRDYLKMLRDGGLESEGLKRQWAHQIDMIDSPKGQAEGISSTRIREAVAEKNWKEVEALCTPSVAAWLSESSEENK